MLTRKHKPCRMHFGGTLPDFLDFLIRRFCAANRAHVVHETGPQTFSTLQQFSYLAELFDPCLQPGIDQIADLGHRLLRLAFFFQGGDMLILRTREDVVLAVVGIDPTDDAVGHRGKIRRGRRSRFTADLRHGHGGGPHGTERFAGKLARFHQGLHGRTGVAQAGTTGLGDRRHHGIELALGDAGGIPGQHQCLRKFIRLQLSLNEGIGGKCRHIGEHFQGEHRSSTKAAYRHFRQAGGVGHLAQAFLDLPHAGVQAAFADLQRRLGKSVNSFCRLEHGIGRIAALPAQHPGSIGRGARGLLLGARGLLGNADRHAGFAHLPAGLPGGVGQLVDRLRALPYLGRIYND